MKTFATLLAFAASALAYQVTNPTNSTGWTTTGPNTVTWTRVSTDAETFTIVLSNQSKFPPESEVLVAQVDGTKATSITVSPPSGGWVAGAGYQVNLVKDAQNLDAILAQSGQFTIKTGTASTTASGTTSGATLSVPAASNTAATTAGGSNSNSATDLNPSTSSDTPTTPTNGAASNMGVQTALFGLIALVGAFLA
ncbi:GPI-anchored Adhesion Regulator [Abortiporus biennis]